MALDISQPTSRGATALHRAVCKNHIAAVAFLCKYAVSSDEHEQATQRNSEKSAPAKSLSELRVAALQKQNRAAQQASSSGSGSSVAQLLDVDEVDSYKRTALHWAALHHNTRCVQLLLERKASIRLYDATQATPLILAQRKPRVSSELKELLSASK
jgi:hypothetical protein